MTKKETEPTSYYPARIAAVAPHSAAAKARLQPGDTLLAINDELLRDVIDVQILAAEPELTFLIERDGKQQERRTQRHYGQPLGLDFEEELFDGPLRVCRNNCDFCFVAQMAPHMRRSLYVKDDDYRLSFLHGNYITLTNLSEADWERIEEQYLSPLYISVHATAPDVRVGLMHNPRAGQILEHLTRLVEMGIEVHTQAVLVPGRNDGAVLDRTIADLAALAPGVASLCIVPVGLTRWHTPGLHPYTDAEAAVILAQVQGWQTRLHEELGVHFVYPSDEWYLRAGEPVPPIETYDALLPALIENGVGMLRRFTDTWPEQQQALAAQGGPRQTWATGSLFAPFLQTYAATFSQETGISAEVVAVPNQLFGETVTVAGLLGGADILSALGDRDLGDVVVLPEALFRGPQGQTLDEKHPEALASTLNRKLYIAEEL